MSWYSSTSRLRAMPANIMADRGHRAQPASVFIPLAVGGGIRSVADARKILLSGADKVIGQHGGSSAA